MYFINKILKLKEKIYIDDLEKYSSSFITKNLKSQEADIIYKIKNQKVFILIEHQTKIDYSMPYRILNYQIEIIRSCVDTKKLKNKNYEHALIIAIVLYTGNRKWSAKTHIREIQATLFKNNKQILLDSNQNSKSQKTLGNCETLGNYKIVDINNYSKEDLLNDKSFLSKMILLEKSKSKEDFLINLNKIIPRISKENKEILLRILNYRFRNYFDKSSFKKIIENIKKEGDENMLAVLEMLEREKRKEEREKIKEQRAIQKERRAMQKELQRNLKMGEARGMARGELRGKRLGRKEEKIFLAKKMLEENLDIKIIQKITGLKKEQFM